MKYKKLMKILFIILLLITMVPLLVIIIAAYTFTPPFRHVCERAAVHMNIACSQCFIGDFADCIHEHFPVGSDAENLDKYLHALDFSRHDNKLNIVYIGPKGRESYRIRVVVNLDEHQKMITKLHVGF